MLTANQGFAWICIGVMYFLLARGLWELKIRKEEFRSPENPYTRDQANDPYTNQNMCCYEHDCNFIHPGESCIELPNVEKKE